MIAILVDAAKEEFDEARDHYEAQKVGLGDRFDEAVRVALERILETPDAFAIVNKTVRMVQVKRFPYGVYYRIDEEKQEILIGAIIHLHRHQRVWRARFQKMKEK
ncbi:MAG: type II toxin-antitoxin system RelE/ParE family toxin [Gemmataceae bacterium]|nr:type II toxin-antitoxin system RelE/ParE family toxin [Gemmataceae bacterium]